MCNQSHLFADQTVMPSVSDNNVNRNCLQSKVIQDAFSIAMNYKHGANGLEMFHENNVIELCTIP
jgi:hypothetical protein